MTSTQCTHFTLETLYLALHGGKYDGIVLTTDSHSNLQEVTLTATMKQYATASNATQNRLSRPHFNAVTSFHQLRCRTQRRHQNCQLHHLIIAPSTHHEIARNSHVVTSRTAQSNLSRFQHWLTQTFPLCQRHHVFLSTRVHDHIRQVTRFVRREIGVVANRQGVQRESRNMTD